MIKNTIGQALHMASMKSRFFLITVHWLPNDRVKHAHRTSDVRIR